MATVDMHGHPGTLCYNGACTHAPEVSGTNRRCRCRGDYRRMDNGMCYVCKGFIFADWEWELLTDGNSAGFVETDQEDIYPVTVMVYLGTHGKENAGEYVKISNVKESSISIENRKGVQTLVCESFVTDRIAYVPFAVWYMTECQTEVQPY